MPFTITDFRDLLQLLETHPEWRADLRRFVLTDEVLAMPEQLTQLRVRSEEQFQTLIAAQQQTEKRLAALAALVDALAGQMAVLVAAQERTEAQMATLLNDVGDLKGYTLEAKHITKGYAYFQRIVRRPHVLSPDELTSLIEDAYDNGALSEAESDDLFAVDVVVRGRRPVDRTEVYLVVEVSWGIGVHDVGRALRRAALLARLGVATLPVVAGRWINADATQYAQSSQVWQLLDGRAIPPPARTAS